MQPVFGNIVGDGFPFFLVVGAAVDDNTFEGLVANYVCVLLKQVERECLYCYHDDLLKGEIDDVFLFEPLFVEEGTDVSDIHYFMEWSCLCLKVAALEA